MNIIFFPYFWAEVRKNLLESNISSIVWNTLLSYTNFIEVADKVSEKTGKTERASLIFIGLMYLVVGILILLYPKFVYYWVSVIFLIQGVSSLVSAWQKSENKE